MRLFRVEYGLLISSLIYLVSLLALPPQYLGDTAYYVSDIQKYYETGNRILLWEAGHLLWRPIGYVATLANDIIIQRPFDPSNILTVLMVTNGAFGWLFVICIYLTARTFTTQTYSSFVAIGAVTTNAFVNYVHSGCSYVPGLASLAVATYIAVATPKTYSIRNTLAFAFFLALSVSLWLPYILAFPALVVVFALRRAGQASFISAVVYSSGFVVLLLIGLYFIAIRLAGLTDTREIAQWFQSSSHGITHEGGVHRAAFGLARSFVYMGDDGNLFKRFLLRDPYNPVSVTELMRVSLVKLMLLYAWIIASLYAVWQFSSVDVKIALALAFMSVLGFAIHWQGGDMERYFPLFPLLALGVATTLRQDGSLRRLINMVNLLFMMTLLVSNIVARTLDETRTQQRIQNRVQMVSSLVAAGDLHQGDLLILATPQDELFHSRSNFWNARLLQVRFSHPVWLGHKDAPKWRYQVTKEIFSAWLKGSQVWVSKRLLAQKPDATWKWVEGDDPRVSWKDVHSFFAALEYGKAVGGHDGFRQLLRTPENMRLLSRWVESMP